MSDGHRWRETRLDRPSVMDRLRALFGKQEASLREDIEEALEGEATGGDLLPLERSMLKNVLNLHQLRVSDVMVPRGEIVAVQDSDSLGQVLSVFRTAGHSRLPVYVDSLDDPRGMIHIRDFLGFLAVPAHVANPAESQETLDPARACLHSRGSRHRPSCSFRAPVDACARTSHQDAICANAHGAGD
jgi:Mg2+/Co2+ transporter CorC